MTAKEIELRSIEMLKGSNRVYFGIITLGRKMGSLSKEDVLKNFDLHRGEVVALKESLPKEHADLQSHYQNIIDEIDEMRKTIDEL